MSIHLRKGRSSDLPFIYKLVQELAEYERAADQVTASLDDYHRDFQNGDFQFIVAEKENTIVGMALFYLTYSTWKGRMMYLEDFVVTFDHRRQGIGQLLFDGVLKEARDQHCVLMKWQVLDWNTPAIEFYKRNSAILEDEWLNGKIFLNPA